jgi:hypothetical protein
VLPCDSGYRNCVQEQIGILEGYFHSIKSLADGCGVSSGLTGGLDSRLLLIFITRHLDNFQFFTTWRATENKEYRIIKELAAAAGQKLEIIPVKEPLEMDDEEALRTLYECCLFYDGQVRTHHLWTEAINTKSYRGQLLQDKRLGFSGIGGEQYRNQERMVTSKRNFRTWLEYELVFKYCGDCFTNPRQKKRFIDYLENKIRILLGSPDGIHADRLMVKQYYNEIYNPSNRTLRMNIENQLAFFLCPYTEYQVSRSAYRIIPHLGAFMKFEADMIKSLSPSLARIPTHYGNDLMGGDPLTAKLMTYLQTAMPAQLSYRVYRRTKRPGLFYRRYEDRFSFVRDNTRQLNDLEMDIDFEKLRTNTFLSPLLVSIGYFLNTFKNRIRLG